MITKPGIYTGMPSDDYFGDPCPAPSFTQSIGKILLEKSPAHAAMEHPRLSPAVPMADEEPEKYDAAKAIGNAAHANLIGRGKDIVEAAFPNFKSKKAQEFRDDIMASGRVPILSKHLDRALAMVKVARDHLDSMDMEDAFRVGNGEVVIAWEEDGIWSRSMIDWMAEPTRIFDYKTTGKSVAPHVVPFMMAGDGWDFQAAQQERGLDAIDPGNTGRRIFRFVAQENEPPYALTVHEITKAVMTMGRKKLQMARSIWDHCIRTGQWPGYPMQINYPEYPGHLESKLLQREIEHSESRARDIPSDLLTAG